MQILYNAFNGTSSTFYFSKKNVHAFYERNQINYVPFLDGNLEESWKGDGSYISKMNGKSLNYR